jgi:hypothetical protein
MVSEHSLLGRPSRQILLVALLCAACVGVFANFIAALPDVYASQLRRHMLLLPPRHVLLRITIDDDIHPAAYRRLVAQFLLYLFYFP